MYRALKPSRSDDGQREVSSTTVRDVLCTQTVYILTASSSGARQLLFFYDSFTELGELYRVGWEGAGLVTLTAINAELRAQSRTQQHPVSFTLPGGKTRTGVLILPAEAAFPPKNQRIVVWQDGGPPTSVQNRWDASVENPFALLPNFGVGVLVTPLYGRYGLGAERFTALVDGSNFGQIDIDEQVAFVRPGNLVPTEE